MEVEAVAAWAFPLPLRFVEGLGVVSDLEFKTLDKSESGRKTAAHRSYSWQSKKDLASRYLLSSLASKAASSGSLFGVIMGDVNDGSGTSSLSVSGSALSSSAALESRG